ncbi:phage tail assembly chaperone [Schauerella aestuarii]|uniref:phage tail assembly chaperone n=1 Tax=Schauerella aestuarii TaxID=2511204 RepID=UPI001368722D|nr:phage tail assembly chaperone [Achromobacter aestuarii]MYZ44217.1 hypothetical protein [Achromobacter aestuarii]
MFKVIAKPTFEGTAKIPVAGEKDADLKLIFKHKTRDEAREYFDRVGKSEASDGEILAEIIEGWKDVDTEFSVEALNQVTQNYHQAVPAIFHCYTAELNKARTKN